MHGHCRAIATVQGSKYATPTLNSFAIWPTQVFRYTVGKTASLNTLGQTACMLLPKESVQGRCWEDSVPEHFGPNCLHTTPLRFPLQPKVFRDAAWQATSLNTCRELKSGVSFKAWWGNAKRIQYLLCFHIQNGSQEVPTRF